MFIYAFFWIYEISICSGKKIIQVFLMEKIGNFKIQNTGIKKVQTNGKSYQSKKKTWKQDLTINKCIKKMAYSSPPKEGHFSLPN